VRCASGHCARPEDVLAWAVRSCLVLLLAALPAGAAEFYVDPVNGSDAGNGSAGSPWRTLQAVIDADLVQSRNWSSLPYTAPGTLVTVNAGAPIKAGDTVWLRTGYHGAPVLAGGDFTPPVVVAAASGEKPTASNVAFKGAKGFTLRGLSISPSYSPMPGAGTMVTIDDSSQRVAVEDSELFSVAGDLHYSGRDGLYRRESDSGAWTPVHSGPVRT